MMNKEQTKRIIIELEKNPQMAENLYRALLSGKYLITITRKEIVDAAHPELDLQHFWCTNQIPMIDVINSFKYITNDFYRNSNINTERQGWH